MQPARLLSQPESGFSYRNPERPVGRYALRLLAKGGTSCAYWAQLGQRKVFVKEVALEHLEAVAQLKSEARTLQCLPLGNFPRFVELFEQDDHLYLVTEFIEGQNLEREVQKNSWVFPESEEVRRLTLELCRLLERLHQLTPPLLYLDLKPANIMRSPLGKLYLVDFGIAQPQLQSVTPGRLQGSPLTASPEHFTGRVDVRSDLFSLAATVYYVATRGQFRRADWGPFPPATHYHPDLHPHLAGWLERCLEPLPERRFGSVSEAREALESPPKVAPKPAKRGWFPWGKSGSGRG